MCVLINTRECTGIQCAHLFVSARVAPGQRLVYKLALGVIVEMAEKFLPKRLNQLRGSGLGSRMEVSPENLLEGWRFERRSEKYCVWFDDRVK